MYYWNCRLIFNKETLPGQKECYCLVQVILAGGAKIKEMMQVMKG